MSDSSGEVHRPEHRELRADCARCVGLCCVALPFTASSDFPIDKATGEPCRHLRSDSRCAIHTRLRERGFVGCTVYDCFGAGQHLTQVTFGGRDWRGDSGLAREMFTVFPVMRQLHELLWFLYEARELAAGALRAELEPMVAATEALTGGDAATLAGLDVAAHRDAANALLRRASEQARATAPGPRPDHRGADLLGARLAGADLRGASLRGACLVAADLRGAKLALADVTGADLRDADLRGTDVSGCLFLTAPQLAAARGDDATRIPTSWERPAHW